MDPVENPHLNKLWKIFVSEDKDEADDERVKGRWLKKIVKGICDWRLGLPVGAMELDDPNLPDWIKKVGTLAPEYKDKVAQMHHDIEALWANLDPDITPPLPPRTRITTSANPLPTLKTLELLPQANKVVHDFVTSTAFTHSFCLLILGHRFTLGSAMEKLPPSPLECFRAFVAGHAKDEEGRRKVAERNLARKKEALLNPTAEHNITVYEVRVQQGHGIRFHIHELKPATSKPKVPSSESWLDSLVNDGSDSDDGENGNVEGLKPYTVEFRGFLEPPMEGGHDVGWRH
ncbi:hypothetical protein HDU76_006624 [Blyttiomyces sp. JEL0837]|nr:hypothetical protein HDU76_006624 [Blyttiomyces sp. JEL0837]